MEEQNWKNDPNKRTLIIIRRSGYGQKENTSGETQRRENLDYAIRNNLDVVYTESIIETAFKTKQRKKFHALIEKALKEKIRHVVFFWSSREARNLTDIEENDELIKSGKVVIHHVSECRVYWEKTPDADFTFRDMNAVMNKGESRSKSTLLKASLKTKALSGWWPYRHTTLGYVHHKERDRYGNGIKGTAKIALDDPNIVKLVQREFALRAEGISYDEIKKRNLAEGLVPLELKKTYSRHAIELRMKNPFYTGYFYLTNDPTRYKGNHELFIPAKTLKIVEAINSGNMLKPRGSIGLGDDIFRGWLTCGHPECKRLITFEKKEKKLKSTGESKFYHLYRCSNSRKIHDKHIYLSEEKVWNQFEPVLDAVTIDTDFAKEILAALEETEAAQRVAIKKQMEGYRIALKELEQKEDEAYTDLKKNLLSDSHYQRKIARIREERDDFNEQLEHLNLSISDAGMLAVKKVLELATEAKSLWKTMSRVERLEFLKKACSNPTLDALTLEYQIKKPFSRIASWKGKIEWRRERDSNS